jgi:serine kinase of HPr protein (carbohydrate metabolism regulator)
MTDLQPTIHACCLILGRSGVLIRGPSGSGKSRLVLELLQDAQAQSVFARLVADDRVHVAAHNGRLIAHSPVALTGRIEARGLDVVTLPHADAAVLRLVVDLVPESQMPRLIDENAAIITLLGVALPLLHTSPEAARRLIPVAVGTILGSA